MENPWKAPRFASLISLKKLFRLKSSIKHSTQCFNTRSHTSTLVKKYSSTRCIFSSLFWKNIRARSRRDSLCLIRQNHMLWVNVGLGISFAVCCWPIQESVSLGKPKTVWILELKRILRCVTKIQKWLLNMKNSHA